MRLQSETAGRFDASLRRLRQSFPTLEYPCKSLAAHVWMECVFFALHLFYFVESAVLHRHFKWESIFRNTLLLCLQEEDDSP